ncbi:MAG: LLM class flavin-dependent oxidoreductase, partial [Candidatus Binatia bacterium]
YQFDRVEFAAIEGYEYYAKLADNIAKHGLEKFNSFLADLQVWGTPGEVVEKLLKAVEYLDVGALLTTLCYGGMPPEVARSNFDLFVSRVLPVLKAHDVGGDIGVRYGAGPDSSRVLAANT